MQKSTGYILPANKLKVKIRAMKIAHMAHRYGVDLCPHSSTV